MTKVVDRLSRNRGRPTIVCDLSPPRGGLPALLEPAARLDVDFVSVAYNPGRSVRASSPLTAAWIKASTGRDVLFTLATRDMNRLALQSLLLGAQLLGLENVVVVMGDEFTQRELRQVRSVKDYRPTELIRSIARLNEGLDYRERSLLRPTDFCIGASIDLSRGIESEVMLTRRKVESGAHFFISQPTFDPALPAELMSRYADEYGEELTTPIFHGVQVMAARGIVFGSVPRWVTDDLEAGRSGVEIASQVLGSFIDAGLSSIYLVPPIMRGGRRDYDATQAVVEGLRA